MVKALLAIATDFVLVYISFSQPEVPSRWALPFITYYICQCADLVVLGLLFFTHL